MKERTNRKKEKPQKRNRVRKMECWKWKKNEWKYANEMIERKKKEIRK